MKGLLFTLAVSILCHCFALAQPNIVSGEYFIDQYVDFGKGQALQVESQHDLTLNTTINVAALDPGLHQLYFRFKNDEGSWSQANSTVFYKAAESTDTTIVGYEYFFDQYKDYGKGNFVALQQDSQIYTIPTNDLKPGLHVLYVRAKSSEQKWSLINQSVFYVPEKDEIHNIVRLEYFFKDGAGNTTDTYKFSDFTPAPTVELSNNDFKANTSALTDGENYTLYVRAFADNGKSSMTSVTTFTLKQVTAINISEIEVTKVGCGEKSTGKIKILANGGSGTLQYSLDGVNFSTSSTFEQLEAGDYKVYIKGDETGYVETRDVKVEASVMPAKPTIASRESKSGLFLFINNPEGDIQWYRNGAAIAGATAAEMEVKGDGSYHVTVTNSDGCTASSEAISITGIVDIHLTSETIVYPNPTSENLFVTLPEQIKGKNKIHLLIYNATGGVMLKKELLVTSDTPINLKTDSFKSGLYFLMVKGKDYLIVKKFQKISN